MAESKFSIVFEAVTRALEQGLKQTATQADKTTRSLDKTKGASLQVREASLKVEQAQQRAARATSRYGQDSLQATAASLKLERAQRELNAQTGKTHKSMLSLSGVVKTAATSFAAFAAVDFLKESVASAEKAQVAQARLATQLKATGVSYKAHAEEIQKVIEKTSSLSGLTGHDLNDAFTNIVRSTGNVTKSLNLVSLAADIARAKHLDVAKAGQLLGKVAAGNVSALSRYGIQIDKGATSTQALGILQQKFGGQAEAYGKTAAGAQDRFRVAVEHLQESIGAGLLPALTGIINKINPFVQGMSDGTGAGGKFADVVKSIVGVVGSAVSGVKTLTARFKEGKPAAIAIGAAVAGVAVGLAALKVGMTAAKAIAAVNLAMDANPAILITAAIVGLGVALVVVYKKSQTFRTIVQGVFKVIRTIIGTEIGLIVGYFSLFLGGLSSILTAASGIPLIGGKFKAAAKGIDSARDSLSNVVDQIKGVEHHKDTTVKVHVKVFGAGVLGDLGSTLKGLASKASGDGIGVSLPVGSGSVSGGLKGANAGLSPVAAIGSRFGLGVSSGLRPGATTVSGGVSYHSSGEAIDLADGKGPDSNKLRFFQYMKQQFGGRLAELIYTPGGAGIKDGKPYTYTGAVAAEHFDHVHVALDLGKPGVGIGDGKGRMRAPRFGGDGIGTAVKAAKGAGLSGQSLVTAVAIAGAESGFNPHARLVSPVEDSRGLWQINTYAHPEWAKSNLYDPATDARAMIAVSNHGRNWGPWSTFTSGRYKAFMSRARAAIGGGGGSSSSGGAPSSGNSDLAGSRVVNAIAKPLFAGTSTPGHLGIGHRYVSGSTTAGIRGLDKRQTNLSGVIDRGDTRYDQASRFFDQSEEDLGTATGRTKRTSEITALKGLKEKQLARRQQRAAALGREISKYETLIRKLRGTLHGKNRVKGAAAAKVHERLRTYEDALDGLKAERVALGFSITDTKLDLGDLANEQAKVSATPDNAPDSSGDASSGDTSSSSDDAGQLADALRSLQASIDQQNAYAESVTAVTGREVARALADLLNGEIVGVGLRGRNATAGAGTVTRY